MHLSLLRNNLFKLAVLTCLVVASSILFYYYGVFLPNQKQIQFKADQDAKTFARNIDCQKYSAQVESQIEGLFTSMKLVSGVFYSQRENSCLYAGIDYGDRIVVIDVLTKQSIFSEELKNMRAKNVGDEIKLLIEEYK